MVNPQMLDVVGTLLSQLLERSFANQTPNAFCDSPATRFILNGKMVLRGCQLVGNRRIPSVDISEDMHCVCGSHLRNIFAHTNFFVARHSFITANASVAEMHNKRSGRLPRHNERGQL